LFAFSSKFWRFQFASGADWPGFHRKWDEPSSRRWVEG